MKLFCKDTYSKTAQYSSLAEHGSQETWKEGAGQEKKKAERGHGGTKRVEGEGVKR